MKVQWDDGGGRILLGDNTVGRAVILRQRSGSIVLEFGFYVHSTMYCIYLQLIDLYTVDPWLTNSIRSRGLVVSQDYFSHKK
jgi:hypothetical protein